MNKHKKVLGTKCFIFLFVLGLSSFNYSYYANATNVESSIIKIQDTTSPEYQNLESILSGVGQTPRGLIGDLIATIFAPSGYIYSVYVEGFSKLIDTPNADGTIPLWNQGARQLEKSNISQTSDGAISISGDFKVKDLVIDDSFTFTGGNPANGKVLTSDENGKAIWSDGRCIPNGNGADNTCYGDRALSNNTNGGGNSAYGSLVLKNNTTGSSNSAFGAFSMIKNTTGFANTAIGVDSLYHNTTGANNVALGMNSLQDNESGSYNTAAGLNALLRNKTGRSNVAIGAGSMEENIDGYMNVAIGNSSLAKNINGIDNVGVGSYALHKNTTGVENTATGMVALMDNETGKDNSAYGHASLRENISGDRNTAIGKLSLRENKSGNDNVALGYKSGYTLNGGNNNISIGTNTNLPNTSGSNQLNIGNTIFGTNIGQNSKKIGIGTINPQATLDIKGDIKISGGNPGEGKVLTSDSSGKARWDNVENCIATGTGNGNTCYGKDVLQNNTYGKYNTGIGYNSLFSNTTGEGNTAVGYHSLTRNINGRENVALGFSALSSNIDGEENTAIGYQALHQNISGDSNIAAGFQPLYMNIDGSNNIANGYQALFNNLKGDDNIANGKYSLKNNTTGYSNIASGIESLYRNITGNHNIATGSHSLYYNTIGSYNIASGQSSLLRNTTGSNNISIGQQSLHNNNTGSENIATGYRAGHNLRSGDNNIAIGANTEFENPNGSNQLNIGNWVYGSDGKISIGTSEIGSQLTVESNNLVNAGAETSTLKLLMPFNEAGKLSNYKVPRSQLNISAGGWNTARISVNGTDGRFSIWTANQNRGTAWKESFTLDKDGKIGIGVTDPQATLDIKGDIKISGGNPGEGKVLTSDANGKARWEEGGIGSNPNDCSETTKNINGHIYPVIALTNGNGYVSSYIENISHGNIQWTQKFACNRGLISTRGGEDFNYYCDNGYIWNNNTCVLPDESGESNCTQSTQTVNSHAYQVPAINHNFSKPVYSYVQVPHGTLNYKQSFKCINAEISTYGEEELVSTACNSGYLWNGNACVAGSIEDTIEDTYDDTTCNLNDISIIEIAPGGTDTIPEQLNDNTLYRLKGGIYSITRKVKLGNCSAIVGVGNGDTTIQYTGLSYGSEPLIVAEGNSLQSIVKDLRLLGKIEGSGVATGILLNTDKHKLENLRITKTNEFALKIYESDNNIISDLEIQDIDSSYPKAVFIINSDNNDFRNININDIKGFGSKYGFYIQSSRNNSFKNIAIQNIAYFSSSNTGDKTYGFYLYSSRNNILTNITVKKIASSYTAIGIYLSYSDNITLNKIFISENKAQYCDGIQLNDSDNNAFSNIVIQEIFSCRRSYGINYRDGKNNNLSNVNIHGINSNSNYSNYVGTGLQINSSNTTVNNAVLFNNKTGLSVGNDNNTIHRVLSFSNSESGIVLDGNNTTLSDIYSYHNGGKGITGTGNSNFYYNSLRIFGNQGGDDTSGLKRGLASHWLSGFGNGTYSNSATFSTPNWVVYPSNATGWNQTAIGHQDNITWNYPINWVYGRNIPMQTAPVLSSACNLATTSNTKCSPTFGGPSTYNALKKVGEL